MAKMTVAGKTVTITDMNVKGGKLPETYSVKLDIVLDFTSCPSDTILKYAAGGQSARVALQTKLRELPTRKLDAMSKTPTTINVANLELPTDELFLTEEERMAKLIAAMTPEQIAMLTKLASNK